MTEVPWVAAFFNDLRATTLLEVAAVVLGIVYILLIVRRSRLGWIAGGIGSAIYVYIAATARLPMQSALNFYYVVMAFYGWFSWTRGQQQTGQEPPIVRWPVRRHLLAVAAIILVSALTARWLARETHAAWPYLDSFTTWTSLLATWLVTRMKLENWLYWICADCVTVFLFAAQGHPFTAGLFVAYISIATFGFRSWLRRYRTQQLPRAG